jgi:hypothetical protein
VMRRQETEMRRSHRKVLVAKWDENTGKANIGSKPMLL